MPQAPWSQPPALPEPPLLEVWLFERPIGAALACLILGALVYLVLQRLGKPRPALAAAGGLALLGVVAAVAGVMVQTSREIVAERSRRIVEAFVTADEAALADLLAPDLVVDAGGRGASGAGGGGGSGGGGGEAIGREFVIKTAAQVQGRFTIDASRVRNPAAADGPNAARTQVFVRTAGGAPSLTWWLFSWRKGPDGAWRAHTIELLLLNGQKPRMGIENMR